MKPIFGEFPFYFFCLKKSISLHQAVFERQKKKKHQGISQKTKKKKNNKVLFLHRSLSTIQVQNFYNE